MLRRSKEQLPFLYSPRGAFLVSVAFGSIAALGAIEPIVSLLWGGKLDLVGKVLLGAMFVTTALFVTYTILKDRELHKELGEKKRLQHEIERLREHDAAVESERTFMTTDFRDLARFRAAHSAQLYTVQKYILRASDAKQANHLFLASWGLERNMLDNVCDFTANMFTRNKGIRCCASIKALVDPKYENSSPTLLRTHYGIADGTNLRDTEIPYETVSRCSSSKRQTRKLGPRSRTVLAEHYILRRLYNGEIPEYRSDNVCRDISAARKQVAAGQVPEFSYPKRDVEKFYNSIMVVPIVVDARLFVPGMLEIDEQIRITYGYLSVDSKANIMFDDAYDLRTCQEIANDVCSILAEYSRCALHLEFRLANAGDGRKRPSHDRNQAQNPALNRARGRHA